MPQLLRTIVVVGLGGALLAGGVLLVSCADPEPRTDSIVLVILDTVRADRLGCLGGPRDMTPALDRFAAEATVFEQAYSHAPWTLPAVASLYTGRVPAAHGAGGHLGSFRSLPEEALTLAEVCREAGLATGAVVNVQFLTERFGLAQGFDHVDVHLPRTNRDSRKAGPTTDAALAWLTAQGERPFLLVVHYFDAHLVYDPPQPFRRRFAAPVDRESTDHLFGMFGEMQAVRRGEIVLPAALLDRLSALYDGEVAYVDSEFDRLLRGLDRLGLGQRTAVCVVSDHGEEFGDHGGFEHGHTLHDELLHVPLLIRTPGGRGRRVTDQVRLVDVATTLCEVAGLDPPPALVGASLGPLLRGEADTARPVLSQGNMWGPGGAALRRDGWKLMVDVTAPSTGADADAPASAPVRSRLFHVAEDPGETIDLAAARPGLRDTLLADLRRRLERAAAAANQTEAPQLSEQERARLRSLGYVD